MLFFVLVFLAVVYFQRDLLLIVSINKFIIIVVVVCLIVNIIAVCM